MSLKDRLDAEWDSRGVRLPDHFCQWSQSDNETPTRGGWQSELTGLWYRRGRRADTNKKKPRKRKKK